jgi:hypothetical protein
MAKAHRAAPEMAGAKQYPTAAQMIDEGTQQKKTFLFYAGNKKVWYGLHN